MSNETKSPGFSEHHQRHMRTTFRANAAVAALRDSTAGDDTQFQTASEQTGCINSAES